MTKANQYQKPSVETQTAAMKLARANQRPGQTKEQTQLVAQGIQKGIEQYKKQQKAKARELNKALKKAKKSVEANVSEEENEQDTDVMILYKQSLLPWLLLAASWIAFGIYYVTALKESN